MHHHFFPAVLLAASALAGCHHTPLAPKAAAHEAGAPRAAALAPEKFYANPKTQAQLPEAFVLTPAGFPAHAEAERVAAPQRAALAKAIQADPALAKAIAAWPTLAWEARRPVIEAIVKLESATFGVQAPPLVIHDEDGRGPAFFEFDVAKPGTGTVHLWPKQLAEEPSPHADLLLAIHETRHSWQFQAAFAQAGRKVPTGLATGLAAGFRAQTALAGKLSFSDFCTMHHEHEAFRTGNEVVGLLTGFKADTAGMGCWSSQLDAAGRPRIDLLALGKAVGPAGLLAAFNARSKGQFVEMGGRP